MPARTFRTQRVAVLIQAEIGRMLIEDYRDILPGIVTLTGVDLSGDLRTAKVRFSVYGQADPDLVLDELNKRKGLIRRSLASRVRLKYNPELIFIPDRSPEYQEKIDRLIESVKKKDE